MRAFLRRLMADCLDWCDLIVNGRSARMREILERSDADAIRSDWEAVGRDLYAAAEKVRTEMEQDAAAKRGRAGK